MKKWGTIFSFFLLIAFFAVGIAEGAGTLRLTFKYKNSAGVEQPLSYAYVYLRRAANEPPMEKFFSPADYISGPSSAAGLVTMTVPEGNYYIRVTRRNPVATRPLGPPENGDYTWNQTETITISTNTVTDLGTKYAGIYGPITISGTVKNYSGTPLSGRIVKATIEPCIKADYSSEDPAEWRDTNKCGPEKHIALQRTDANGNYRLFLRDPGTYHIYGSTCLGDQHSQYSGNPCMGVYGGSVTVNAGDNKTVNITGN